MHWWTLSPSNCGDEKRRNRFYKPWGYRWRIILVAPPIVVRKLILEDMDTEFEEVAAVRRIQAFGLWFYRFCRRC